MRASMGATAASILSTNLALLSLSLLRRCEKNPGFMLKSCRKSCSACPEAEDPAGAAPKNAKQELGGGGTGAA